MIRFGEDVCRKLDAALRREWLETNGIVGFASGTIKTCNTRRYHGLLIATTKPPVGRFVLLSKFEENLIVNGSRLNWARTVTRAYCIRKVFSGIRSSAWLKKAKISFGIRSIICLLDQSQLRLYADLKVDLISYYRENGFHSENIPVRNYQHPALSGRQLKKVWKAYQRMERPTLIHCSAGIGRTGKAVSYIKRKLENGTPR